MADSGIECGSASKQTNDKNVADCENRKHLIVTSRGSLKWEGTFESLKRLIDSILEVETKWSMPGGGCKQYVAGDDIDIRWYMSSKSLTIKGVGSDPLKSKMISLAAGNQEQDIIKVNEVDDDDIMSSLTTPTDRTELINLSDTLNTSNILPFIDMVKKLKLLEGRFEEEINEMKIEVNKLKSHERLSGELSREFVDNLISENARLKAENSSLRERGENLSYIASDLNTKVKDLQNERDSLVSAIKSLQSDIGEDGKQTGWQTVKGPNQNISYANRYKTLVVEETDDNDSDTHSEANNIFANANASGQPNTAATRNIRSNKTTNRSTLGKNNESRGFRLRKQKNNTKSSQPLPSEAENKTTLVIGDSMVKDIQGRKLGKAVGHRVVVKSFSGATTKAMKYYLKPNLELSPNQVILHVGTNDLKSKEPHEIAESVVGLARQIETSCNATVIVSEIICRRRSLNENAKRVNTLLRKYCQQNKWNLIQHENISFKELNRGGLHLNYRGNLTLFKNLQSNLH